MNHNNDQESRKRAILVMGPPSSGTRFMTRLMTGAGFRGGWEHSQFWDSVDPLTKEIEKESVKIVIRRHYPTERLPDWCGGMDIISALLDRKYEIDILIMCREETALIKSICRAPHAADEDSAKELIDQCYMSIFSHVNYLIPFRKLLHPHDMTKTREWRREGGGSLPLQDKVKFHMVSYEALVGYGSFIAIDGLCRRLRIDDDGRLRLLDLLNRKLIPIVDGNIKWWEDYLREYRDVIDTAIKSDLRGVGEVIEVNHENK